LDALEKDGATRAVEKSWRSRKIIVAICGLLSKVIRMQTTPATISPVAAKILKGLFVLTLESNSGLVLTVDSNLQHVTVSAPGSFADWISVGSSYYGGRFYEDRELAGLLVDARKFAAQ